LQIKIQRLLPQRREITLKGRHNDFCLLMQSSGRVEPCRSLRGRSDPLTSRRPVKYRTTEEVSSQVDRQVCLTQIPSGRKAGIVDRKGSRARELPWSPPLQQPGLRERAGWRRRRTGESDIGNGAGTIREQVPEPVPFSRFAKLIEKSPSGKGFTRCPI
jgi:hypothetical protein